jgi:valyl-tRNA synthetase
MNITSAIHKFWLYELCDVYIEAIKPICEGDDTVKRDSVRQTLYTCLDQGLKLLHPFMPFLTEELYQRLPRRIGDTVPSIMIAAYPEWVHQWDMTEEEKKFETINQICRAARSLMADYGLKSNVKSTYKDNYYDYNTH